VITCPNCGTQNQTGSRFCSECGADLRTLQVASEPTPASAPVPAIPPQYDLGSPSPKSGGWSSTQDFVPPTQKPRRTWLWIVVGVIGACLLLCCATSIWSVTSSGQNFLNDIETRLADYQTETAD
jgi:hypothetical protein